MNLSLMSFHIILVISSPSSSTTGFLTLILLEELASLCCDTEPILADSAASLRLAVEEDMVRYVLEDWDDVYLSDLDGACTAE